MLKLQTNRLSAVVALATVCGASLTGLPAMATDFDSTVTDVSGWGNKAFRWEVTNSETGEVAAWGLTRSERKAKKKAKQKEEELEEMTGGSGVIVDDDFGCEILDAGNPDCG